jgi:hypothetical protein
MSGSSEGFVFLCSLSYDAMLEVLSLLSVEDLGHLSQVSKEANALADDDVVWRRLCRGLEIQWSKLLNRPVSMVPKIQSNERWKDTYRKERERVNVTSKFVGLWSEKWCDVNVPQSTLIESDGNSFAVAYKKNKFAARFMNFDGDTLTFHLEGGDSGWAFVYKLRPLSDSLLHLHVFRVHDQKTFTGVFTKCTTTTTAEQTAVAMQH